MSTNFELKYVYNKGLLMPIPVPTDNNYLDQLQPGVYEFKVVETPMSREYGFQPLPDLSIPENIINQDDQLNKVISTYTRLGKQMGVLFSGISGSGKTVLAKRIAMECVDKGKMPVIIITSETVGDLPLVLSIIKQPCVFFLDEFEKMFEKARDQNFLLTILDGINQYNHLFLMTCNESDNINGYMLRRPSRIRYHFKFDRVPTAIVDEIINRNYVPAVDSFVDTLRIICDNIRSLSYDLLFEIIREGNLYPNVNPMEFTKDLSIPSLSVGFREHDYFAVIGGKEYKLNENTEIEFKGKSKGDIDFKLANLYKSDVRFELNELIVGKEIGSNFTFRVYAHKIDKDEVTHSDTSSIEYRLTPLTDLVDLAGVNEFRFKVALKGEANFYDWVGVDDATDLYRKLPELRDFEFIFKKK